MGDGSAQQAVVRRLPSQQKEAPIGLDDLAKKAGYDSAQAFYDELKNQMLKAMEDAMKKEVAKGIDTNSKGSYKVAGGKVIFAEGGSKLGLGQGQINKDGSITIKISDSQLKIDHIDFVKNN